LAHSDTISAAKPWDDEVTKSYKCYRQQRIQILCTNA
jgi:hypothetical protein